MSVFAGSRGLLCPAESFRVQQRCLLPSQKEETKIGPSRTAALPDFALKALRLFVFSPGLLMGHRISVGICEATVPLPLASQI